MQPSDPSAPAPGHESIGIRDRTTVVTSAVLLAITAVAWVIVVSSSMQSQDMAMDGDTSMLADSLTFVTGWAVMMTAMMLPSALPMIALYGATQRKAAGSGTQGVPLALFTLVYLGLWAAVGVPVYLASTFLAGITTPLLSYGLAAILIAAGAYQLSPLKQVCLRVCRSPLGFLLGHWRPGRRGSLILGLAHAWYCLGCCWALMVVLVAAGAMGLPWVLLIAAVVAAEKLLPGGEWVARLAGGALVLLGVAVALRPDLVTLLRSGHAM